MVKNKRILISILGISTLCLLGLETNPALADPPLTTNSTFTVAMPIINSINIAATTTFPAITASTDVGHGKLGTHKVAVGDSLGTVGYLASNEPSVAGVLASETYTVTFTPGSGGSQTCTMAAGGIISLTDTSGGTPMLIDVITADGSAGAKLGGVAMTETDGASPKFTTPGTGTLTFTNGLAYLDLTLSLDESSLTAHTTAGNRAIIVTFSATTLTDVGG